MFYQVTLYDKSLVDFEFDQAFSLRGQRLLVGLKERVLIYRAGKKGEVEKRTPSRMDSGCVKVGTKNAS